MKKYNNREIHFEISFNESLVGKDRFANLYAAESWCKNNGYTVGQHCAMQPTCLLIGEYDWIAKWKNLTKREQSQADGIMINDRGGNYFVYLFNFPVDFWVTKGYTSIVIPSVNISDRYMHVLAYPLKDCHPVTLEKLDQE